MLIPYKQTLSHSCLAACMLMLREKPFTECEESDLTLRGSKRVHQFYVAGIPLEFAQKYDSQINVFVDNKYFADILRGIFSSDKRISIIQKKLTIPLIKDLLINAPLICHIDDHSLGDYSHSSHFIILEKATDQFVQIIDPWTGKRRKLKLSKLEESLSDLKTQIKMCPLLFTIDVF